MIKSSEQFASMWSKLASVIDSKARLPDQVFLGGFEKFLFSGFDLILSERFWGKKDHLKLTAGKTIFVIVVDPDPVEYFYKEFGEYGCVVLHEALSSSDFVRLLEEGPADSPADAPLFNSSVVAVIPDSLEWAIFAERDLDICVVALRTNEDRESWISSGNWFDFQSAKSFIANAGRGDPVLTESIIDGIGRNYSCSE